MYGNDHPDVALSLHSLGQVLRDRGNAEAAEQCYREELDIWRKVSSTKCSTWWRFVDGGWLRLCIVAFCGIALRDAGQAARCVNLAHQSCHDDERAAKVWRR